MEEEGNHMIDRMLGHNTVNTSQLGSLGGGAGDERQGRRWPESWTPELSDTVSASEPLANLYWTAQHA
jgi:hypothetical protein